MKLKVIFLLFCILTLAVSLRFYQLSNQMQFGGDEGWGYLVARDAILTHTLPVFGPPTSLGWFRLGPLPYYLLTLSVLLGRFNPVSFAFTTGAFDIISVFLVYKIGRKLLNARTGLIASVLYSTSPFIILHSRVPLYVNLVPLFSCLFYLFWFSCIRESRNKAKVRNYFLLCCFSFGILIQFHVTPVLLLPVFIITLIKKVSLKTIFLGFIFFLIPLLPFIYSEWMTRFEMTKKIILWFPYRILSSVGLFTNKNIITPDRFYVAKSVYANSLADSIFPALPFIGIIIIIFSVYFLYTRMKRRFSFPILGSFFLATAGIFIHGQPAEHYLLYIIPLIVISVSIALSRIKLGFIVLFILIAGNVFYFMSFGLKGGIPLAEKRKVVEKIIAESKGNLYKIVPSGDIVNLPHYYDAYRYLGFYLGKEPTQGGILTFKIYEREVPDFMLFYAKKVYRFDHVTLARF